MLVNIRSTHKLLGTVPHGQPRGWVVKEDTVVTCPYHTPKKRRQRRSFPFSFAKEEVKMSDVCDTYQGVPGMGLVAMGLAFCATRSSSVISSSLSFSTKL